LAHKETDLEREMNSAWNSDDEKDMNNLAKETMKG